MSRKEGKEAKNVHSANLLACFTPRISLPVLSYSTCLAARGGCLKQRRSPGGCFSQTGFAIAVASIPTRCFEKVKESIGRPALDKLGVVSLS